MFRLIEHDMLVDRSHARIAKFSWESNALLGLQLTIRAVFVVTKIIYAIIPKDFDP